MTLIDIINHRSLMQTEESQLEGERIMPETRFIELPALSVKPRFRHYALTRGWDFSVCIGDRCLIIFLTYDIKNYKLSFVISLFISARSRAAEYAIVNCLETVKTLERSKCLEMSGF